MKSPGGKAAIAAIFFCLALPDTHGQERRYHFDRLTGADGISSNRLYDVARDTSGFLWIGTLEGLDRYDGYGVRTFRFSKSDPQTLPEGAVTSLYLDKAGRLWAGTSSGGLSYLDDNFERFIRVPLDTILGGSRIDALCEDRSGNLWIATRGSGLVVLTIATAIPKPVDDAPASDRPGQISHKSYRNKAGPLRITSDTAYCIIQDRSGTIWAGTEQGVNTFHEGNPGIRYAHDPHDPLSLSDNEVLSIMEDQAGTIWIGTNNGGLNRFDRGTGQFVRYQNTSLNARSLSDNKVYCLWEQDSRYIWVGTSSGLNILDRMTNDFTRIVHDEADPLSLGSNLIRSIRSFDSEVTWIATDEFLSKFRKRTDHFRHYVLRDPGGSPENILAIRETRDGRLCMAPEAGALIIIQNGKTKRYAHDPSNPTSISGGWINTILEDSRGNLWIGTGSGKLDCLERETAQFKHYQWWKSAEEASDITCLVEDFDGFLWLGTYNVGILRFDPAEGEFRHFQHDPSDRSSISPGPVTAFLASRDGDLWIATEGGGLNRMDKTTGGFINYAEGKVGSGELTSNKIFDIHEGPGGILWLGTAGGLTRFDPAKGMFEEINMGESARDVMEILRDHRGHLWLATFQSGLFRFDPELRSFAQYDVSDGLQSNRFNSDAGLVRRNGEILVGGVGGYTVFHPDSIQVNRHIPPVVLTSIRLFDEDLPLPVSIRSLKDITLSYDENYLGFGFAALDYAAPTKNKYVYRLEDLDQTWFTPEDRPYARYTAVPPGKYLFRVKGSNSDGIWNDKGLAFPVHITPPYWQTWWFRGLVVFFIIAIGSGAYQYRVSQLLKLERLRVQIASDLHDDIGTNLSSIALITDIVRNQLPARGQENHNRSLADAGRTARQAADSLKDIVWLIKAGNETLGDLLLRLRDAASQILAGHQHSFSTSGTGSTEILDMEVRRNLILMYKESLNNIIKHARADHVQITMNTSTEMIELTIKDNGVGFDEAEIRKGNGLNNLRRRTVAMGGSIDIRSAPGQGTQVVVSVPVHGAPVQPLSVRLRLLVRSEFTMARRAISRILTGPGRDQDHV